MSAMESDDPRHGTENGYGNLRCRCAPCTEAHRVYCAKSRIAYRAHPWPESVKHGTYNAYCNYGCRCDECRKASTAYARDYYVRTRKAS